jgi:hypothetical protein
VNAREQRAERVAGAAGLDHAVPHTDHVEHRVVVVRDGRRIVGERHDFAFVLQLAHVQQVGDVLEEDTERASRGRCRDPPQAAVLEGRDRRRETVAESIDGQHRTVGKPGGVRGARGVGLVMIDYRERGAGQAMGHQLPAERLAAHRARQAPRRPFGHSILHRARQARQRSRKSLAAAHGVVPFLAARPHASERLGRIRRRRGNDIDVGGRQPRVRQACGNGAGRKADLELAPRQPFFVDGELEPAILEQSRARVVPVPQAEDVHGLVSLRRGIRRKGT